MTGPKLNERPGTRAVIRNIGIPPRKARQVLDLIRERPIVEARDTLKLCERAASEPILKVLNSAVANAENNSRATGEELAVVAAYADEARSLGRIRPRARGQASPITKRACHITVIVARMEDSQLERFKKKQQENAELRRRRVRASRAAAATEAEVVDDEEVETTGFDPASSADSSEVVEDAGSNPEAEKPAKKATAKKAAAKKTTAKKAPAKKDVAAKKTESVEESAGSNPDAPAATEEDEK